MLEIKTNHIAPGYPLYNDDVLNIAKSIGDRLNNYVSPDYLYELKLDGEWCIAYLDVEGTDLRNKRNLKMLPRVPELSEIHTQVKCRCILDGELAVIYDGKPDFFLIQRRSMMSNPVKIQLEAQRHPACITAFDILYYEDHPVTDLPLTERKKLLESVIKEESPRFAVSRWVEGQGIAFYELAKDQNLEGIVAKRNSMHGAPPGNPFVYAALLSLPLPTPSASGDPRFPPGF